MTGTVSLQPRLLRLSQWTKDFNHYSQTQTHASIWIRLVALPQEYWRERTLKEIASVVGTPISIDGPTRNRAFGHYARILVDVLSKRVYDEILVERESFAFNVEVQYERRPLFCHHCYVIGHNEMNCKRLNPEAVKVPDRGKKQVTDAASNPPRVGNRASSSGTLCYVPLPTVAPSAETHAVVPTPTADAHADVPPPTAETCAAVPPTVAAIPDNNATYVVPKAAADYIAGTTCSNLQGFSEPIPRGNLPRPNIHVLELAESVMNDDVQLSSETLPVNQNNFSVENDEEQDEDDDEVDFFIEEDGTATAAPKNTTASIPLDLVAVQMPTQATPLSVSDPLVATSTVGSQENNALSIVVLEKHNNGRVQHDMELCEKEYDKQIEVLFGSRSASPVVVERSVEARASMTIPEAQEVVVLQQQHVHPNKNIQHGLDLWDRVREYDARSATEDFTPVLTRKQKQKIKLQKSWQSNPLKPVPGVIIIRLLNEFPPLGC